MQYVRSLSGSVSKTWNSINPATLSGAIDVIVVEHEDGTLACSPFHVRFGKFSLLRPHEKKVEFKVNDVKRDFPMKLGEGGEAFFVFETTTSVPEAMQTSPLVSPVTSPEMRPSSPGGPSLSEADPLELSGQGQKEGIPIPGAHLRTHSDAGAARRSASMSFNSLGESQGDTQLTPPQDMPSIYRSNTDHGLPAEKVELKQPSDSSEPYSKSIERPVSPMTARSSSPSPYTSEEAKTRAINLSKKLWTSNIPSHVTDQGDLMLDMTGYKSSEEEALRAEVVARKILSEELEGNYDIGSLIGADEHGNLWIYSSEEAKEQASRRLTSSLNDLSRMTLVPSTDAISDPGYHSDDARSETSVDLKQAVQHIRHDSDSAVGMSSPPFPNALNPESSKSYAKTLRLTSDQLKELELKPGQNTMSFTVNRATCTASLWLWRYDVPIIISDIDGTITKSDALGHVLNMIGRDWTHLGVAKLYTEIHANGYNFLYLTSRSVGQADTTRAYLNGVMQEGYRLPKGPVIMSPDRTMAALRREVYLRKPEVFKMSCLRDIMSLFHGLSGSRAMFTGGPFYAGFGNRLTDAVSYRSVNIPSTRIFTINTSSEVSIDLVSLSKYRTGYSSMREIVDHFFPPVGLLVKGGGEEFTDFNYWRDKPLDIEDFSASESEDGDDEDDEMEDEEDGDVEDEED
ncbi:LNS2-domain-containing protein, partial [Myriangium duriaei CBS 260.36]